MKAALAIAAAEVRTLRLAFLGGLLFGAVGHIILFQLPSSPRPGNLEPTYRATAAFVPVVCMQLGLAAVFGAGAVSRDLAERRLGFYLARPISPLAYWGAKMAAALLVAYVSGLLMLLPGFLLGPFSVHLATVRAVIAQDRNLLAGLVATGLMLAVAGVAGGAARSRSGLLLLDLVMLLVTSAACLAALCSSWDQGTADVVLSHGMWWVSGIAFLILLAASAAQVSRGRLDLRRGHVSLSAILWIGLFACVGGLALFSRAVASVTPADLELRDSATIQAPPAGGHVLLEGWDTRWDRHRAAFFLDAFGRFVRRPAPWDTGSAWSADGRRFVWLQAPFPMLDAPLLRAKPLQAIPGVGPSLWTMDFDQPGVAPRLVARRAVGIERMSALSPSGRRVLIASVSERSKSIVDADDGRTLASIGESASWSDARFLSETLVRALRVDAWQGRIVDWDIKGARVIERGAIAFAGDPGHLPRRFMPTHDWQRVLRLDGAGLFLHDLDGRLLATLVDGWLGRSSRSVGLLSQGRFGCVDRGPQGLRLRVFDRDGRPQLEARVDGSGVGAESAPGVLVLARGRSWGTRGTFPGESAFVDLVTGNVVRRERGLVPAFHPWTTWAGSASVEPGSLATRLFIGDDGLVLLDPESGARKLLVRRSEP